ncbi:MAG: hypothetical protein JWN70_462, partial [Planctomycetaceae bacterium]|nr:hypothetical protein [Planctomycetaceae bacterium]
MRRRICLSLLATGFWIGIIAVQAQDKKEAPVVPPREGKSE